MKKRMTNEVHIEGWVFDHKLEVKVTGDTSKNPGTEYIAGVLNVATDEKCMNVVPVHYTYVTATTASGKTNNTYNVLKSIIDGAPTVSSVGREGATKVRIDTAIGLNEWYQDEKTLVSVKRNEGGFIHILTNEDVDADEARRSAFKTDMLIQSIFEQDADEERGLPSKVVVKGYIFNFRNQLLPVEFVAIDKNAQKYFLRLECTPNRPFCTWVRGKVVSQTIVTKYVEESAFGEDEVRERKSSNREYVITGAAKEPYVWDDEEFITAKEMSDALAAREVDLATMKQRSEDYQKSRQKASTAASNDGAYNF